MSASAFLSERDQRLSFAVANAIAARRDGGPAEVTSVPDFDDRTNPAVDLLVRDGLGTLAIEHTIIEPFPGIIEANAFARRLFPERYVEVPGLDPSSMYTLTVAPEALRGAAKDVPGVRKAILDWVERTAPRLTLDRYRGTTRVARSAPGELPLDVGLGRSEGVEGSPFTGRVTLSFTASDDREDLRVDRISTSLERKLPKLHAARASADAAALVLETFDLWLTNDDLVREALQGASAGCPHPLPEYVVLVISVGGTSLAWMLYDHGTWPDDGFCELAVPAAD